MSKELLRMGYLFWTLAFGVLAVLPLSTLAACQSGDPMSYDSIQAVMLTSGYRTQDGYHDKWSGITQFSDSAYWVFFHWALPTQYSQYDLQGNIGSYTLEAKLPDAVAILREDRFYELQNPYYLVTDTSQLVLTVLNCSTVTRIIVYRSLRFQAPSVAKIFNDLENLVIRSKKTRTSATPTDFQETLLFDP